MDLKVSVSFPVKKWACWDLHNPQPLKYLSKMQYVSNVFIYKLWFILLGGEGELAQSTPLVFFHCHQDQHMYAAGQHCCLTGREACLAVSVEGKARGGQGGSYAN